MRESIGGAWLTGLVITFMLIFVAYLTVMINYSTVFKIKNEVVHIIEKYEGFTNNKSNLIINQYLLNSGYNAKGSCDGSGDWYGATKLDDGINLQRVQSGKEYYYCVKYNAVDSKTGYFDIKLFLQFDLPVIQQIGKFQIKGQTIKIRYAQTDGLG